MNPEDQIILVDKPAGISSFGVVAKVRGHLRAKFGHKIKVGHTGTLDPFATGLLILLSGKMTKHSNEFLKKDKIYEATLKLGYTSTTGDPEGEITKYQNEIHEHLKKGSEDSLDRQARYCSVEDPLATTGANGATEPRNDGREGARPKRKDIELVTSKFIGKISQTPPRFSAIKVNGERAYKLARKGADFEIPTREVEIYSIDILDYHYPELTIRAHVSSGTYIRTLAEDIGKALGTGAYLTSLRRIKIADYDIKDAHPLSDFID
ncbi:tRNA pseudouridine(55) synthase TruB [Candidatus Saccharibacteria bacterium]|nr:tRNA pseudouridine(55) synthase TruB [Candidatus Saccharibacteria bacterium]